MKQTGRRARKLRWLLLVVLVVLALRLLQGLFTLRSGPVQLLRVEEGWLDLQTVDTAAGVFQLEGSWEFYPGALYTGEDFAAGRVGQPAGEGVSPSDYGCGTHRLRIRATPGAYYAICGFSVDYATRVFVNGSEVAAFGNPAADPADFVPRIGYMTLPLCAGEDGLIELVIQYGNYVHKDGGHIPVLYLSSPQNIQEFKAGNDLISLTLSGGLVLLALYFLINAAMRRRAAYLCLAFCCLLMALRDQNFFIVHLLPEDTSWYFAYRLFLCVVMLMPVSILLLLKCMYARATARWPLAVYLAAAGAAVVLLCSLPTRELVSVSTAVYYLSIPYLAYLAFGTVRGFVRRGGLEAADALVLSGFAVLVASLLHEALLTGRSSDVSHYGTAAWGMLGFVFLNGAAVSLRTQQREADLIESRSRGEMLERMNRMNLEFLHRIAHELRTPLTVISGYAQLTGIQLAADQVDRETPENLKTIQQEARRLGDMVTRLLEYSYGRTSELRFERVDPADLLDRVRAISAPICVKNRNTVQVGRTCTENAYGSFEMLLQVFLNLVINANRHTKNGTITLTADAGEDGVIRFQVWDNGSGIAPADLPHVFEQGYSGSGSTGLGLTICREVVEAHGGRIWVERTGPRGTTIAFTVKKEEVQ